MLIIFIVGDYDVSSAPDSDIMCSSQAILDEESMVSPCIMLYNTNTVYDA